MALVLHPLHDDVTAKPQASLQLGRPGQVDRDHAGFARRHREEAVPASMHKHSHRRRCAVAERAGERFERFGHIDAGLELLGADALGLGPAVEQRHHGPGPLLCLGQRRRLDALCAVDGTASIGGAPLSSGFRHSLLSLMHLTRLGDSLVPSDVDALEPRVRGGEATLGTAHSDQAALARAALDDRQRIACAAAPAWEAERLLHALPPISGALKKKLGLTIASELRQRHRRFVVRVVGDTRRCASSEHGQKSSQSPRICLSEKCLQLSIGGIIVRTWARPR
jgi:hypothetical protein